VIRRVRPRVGVASDSRRRALRRVAAALSAACALIYVLIGVGVLRVDVAGDTQTEGLVFGVLAAAAFGLGTVLLVATDRRSFWVLGAAFQAFTIVTYFQVAERRDPPFEVWGLLLEVLQSIILASLLALVILDRRRDDPERER
jgi:hypothetical protein